MHPSNDEYNYIATDTNTTLEFVQALRRSLNSHTGTLSTRQRPRLNWQILDGNIIVICQGKLLYWQEPVVAKVLPRLREQYLNKSQTTSIMT